MSPTLPATPPVCDAATPWPDAIGMIGLAFAAAFAFYVYMRFRRPS